jgi:hypothetical protein
LRDYWTRYTFSVQQMLRQMLRHISKIIVLLIFYLSSGWAMAVFPGYVHGLANER